MRHHYLAAGLIVASAVAQLGFAAEPHSLIAVVLRAGPNGAHAAEAAAATRELATSGVSSLLPLLVALDTDNVVAANYLRTAIERIVATERAKPQAEQRWPTAELEAYVRDEHHRGRPRRLALALLGAEFRAAQLPHWLDDPEFRDDAVAAIVARGDAELRDGSGEAARKSFQLAFQHARDSDQVLQLVARLKRVDVTVDPARHLGFVTRFYLCGPFDAPGMTGFAKRFGPEERVDLRSSYVGAEGRQVEWRARGTNDPLGQFNLIQEVAAVKEAVAYAYAELEVAEDQEAQLRCSADDNLSVWLDERPVLAREQWLNGTRLDRFLAPVTLTAGRHRLLVKICQGPQHVDPAVPNNWTFQLRFCNSAGGGTKFDVVRPTPAELAPPSGAKP